MDTKVPRIAHAVRFLQVSHLLLWTMWRIYRDRRRIIRAHTSGDYAIKPASAALLRALLHFREKAPRLGVLVIKFGQFLSSRVDLLPEQAVAILSSLQDNVPPEPFEYIVSALESELGKPIREVFSMLEPACTAAASIGQVHKAVLAATGETVAVKVQRPHAEQLIRMDVKALNFVIFIIGRFVNLNGFVDLVDLFHEFERALYKEIDYVQEAANVKRFKEMFQHDPMIYVPRVYDQYVSRRLLVLEWIDGIKINNYSGLDAAGVNRLEVVKRTICAYFYQFFEAGFFHADPHPGNIFVKVEAKRKDPVIAFVDFGIMGFHTKTIKKSLKDVFLAFIARDTQSLVQALARLGFIGEGANLASIEHSLSLLIERYYGMTFGEISKTDIFEMVQDAAHLFYGQPLRIPAQFAFTGRAISTLMSISTELAPEFNIIEAAIPYARKFLGFDAKGMEQALIQFCKHLLATGKTLLTLPRTLERFLTELERGQIEVRIHNGREGAHKELPGGYTFAWPFLFGASLLGGIFLLADVHQFAAGWFCFGLTGLATLRLLLKRA